MTRLLRAAMGALALLLPALFAPTLPLAGQSETSTLAEARAAYHAGQYREAASGLRSLVEADPGAAEARRTLIRLLTETGAFEQAESVARSAPEPSAVANVRGELLERQGRLETAEAAYRTAMEAGGADALAARANLGELLLATGRIDQAMPLFDTFIDVYNAAAGSLSARDLLAVGTAVRHLGRRDPALFQDALKAYDEAAAADPGWPEPRVALGELFLAKYQSPEAKEELGRALALNPRHPSALLALARALEFDGEGDVRSHAEEALEVDPKLAAARAFLARVQLTREERERAREQALLALESNPASLEALSALAAVHYLAGEEDAFGRVRDRALAIHPGYAGLDEAVAELAERTRRYAQAVERARAAVELDSASWSAWGILGMNQLRTGHIAEGRVSLERAFAGDPYNPWFKNNLDLLDTFQRFRVISTEHFELFLREDEADLLAPMVRAYAEEAFDSLSRRYGAEPPTPIRVELYPSHADFSVRTLGEVGLGALGVSFGPVLVMDSPAAREQGEYNWASTLWHELSHSFHLAITDHRVPRWFSEGLSVHEQRQARPGWGHQPTIAFLQAWRADRLKPVSQLNDGFMRPDYPQQVIFSYYQASLVFQLIEEEYGFQAVRDFLEGYRRGSTTEELFAQVLDTPLERFDGVFRSWFEERFDRPLAAVAELENVPPPQAGIDALERYVQRHPGDLVARLRLGALLMQEERFDEAEPHLREAQRIFPEYGGTDSPYGYLAQIDEARGDLTGAVAELERLTRRSETHLDALRKEADLDRTLGRDARAARALERALQIHPYDAELHRGLAELHASLGHPGAVVDAREALVALEPVDRARALYELAVARHEAGDASGARSTLLRALEIAPNYPEALELLLELRSGSTDGSTGGTQ